MHACATTKWLALVHIHLHLSFFSVIVECPLRMHIERVRFLTRVWRIKNFLSVAQQGKLPSIHIDQKCMQPLHSAYTTIEVAAQSLGLGVWIVRASLHRLCRLHLRLSSPLLYGGAADILSPTSPSFLYLLHCACILLPSVISSCTHRTMRRCLVVLLARGQALPARQPLTHLLASQGHEFFRGRI